MAPKRIFELFYLATPLFVAIDVVLGVPARAAGIPHEGWRWAYYAGLVGCWLLCRTWPDGAPLVGALESTVNLLLLLLSILLPIWSVSDQFMTTGSTALLWPPGTWWNFAISAPVLVIGIKLNEKAILTRWSPLQPGARRPST